MNSTREEENQKKTMMKKKAKHNKITSKLVLKLEAMIKRSINRSNRDK
jgi:hypothetical protein